MDGIRAAAATEPLTPLHHTATTATAAPTQEATVDGDAYGGSVPTPDPTLRNPRLRQPSIQNPVIGVAHDAPELEAGDLKSPRFLPTEADYFKEANRILTDAKPGDRICLQMYEWENTATSADDSHAATNSPGFKDQQALLPSMVDATKRGVRVDVILDASKDRETHEIRNAPITKYLEEHADHNNLSVDYYPPETVNIDHAKELVHLTPGENGKMKVQEALTGGSNWGNHTPANDDNGGEFFGRDAVGAAQVFFRDQAFCRGDRTTPAAPQQDANAPVRWAVTSPTAEGGGSQGILDAKLDMTKKADAVYLSQFCLTHKDIVDATTAKGRDAHVRVDPNEFFVNKNALWAVRKAHGEAEWANTQLDPEHMPAQKLHQKLDIYVTGDEATGCTIGSANDTINGLSSTYTAVNPRTGGNLTKRTNHELDAVVTRTTDGDYSTAPFLDAALGRIKDDLEDRSVHTPPQTRSSTTPGNF